MKSLLKATSTAASLLVMLVLGACTPSALPSGSTSPTAARATEAKPVPAAESASPYGITNSLDGSEDLPDGRVLYGHISWTDPVIPPYGALALLAGVRDASGKELLFGDADAGSSPAPGELRQYWAYRLNETEYAAPLTLSFVVQASIPADGGSFVFDPGPEPQLGQVWDIRQDVVVNKQTVHVLSAEQAGIEPGYFLFTMQSDSNIVGAAITDLAHPPSGGGGGGGGVPVAGAPFRSGFGYQAPLPPGPYRLTLTNVAVLVPGDWALKWTP